MAQLNSVRADTAAAAAASSSSTYVRRIGPFSGTMMVVGSIIGSAALIVLGVPVFLFWMGRRVGG